MAEDGGPFLVTATCGTSAPLAGRREPFGVQPHDGRVLIRRAAVRDPDRGLSLFAHPCEGIQGTAAGSSSRTPDWG